MRKRRTTSVVALLVIVVVILFIHQLQQRNLIPAVDFHTPFDGVDNLSPVGPANPADPGLTPEDGLAVSPSHETIVLRNLRWQPMPEDVEEIHIAPDQRVWTKMRLNQQLSEPAFKTMIEREYQKPDPQFAGAELLLIEPPGAGDQSATAPNRGRIWFELVHRANRWDENDRDWGVLLGYSGRPGHWIERMGTDETWSIDGWNWVDEGSYTTQRPIPSSISVNGCAFFVRGSYVDTFDGRNWTSQRLWFQSPPGFAPLQPLAEPDGKGVVVTIPRQYGQMAVLWHMSSTEVWRWRDGTWRKISLPVPKSFTEFDTNPILGDGGMWNYTREGLWFSSFDGSTDPPTPKCEIGPYKFSGPNLWSEPYGWYHPWLIYTDEKGRLYVGSDLVWKTDESNGPNPDLQPLCNEYDAALKMNPQNLSFMQEIECTLVKKGGGIIVREPDGSCHLMAGVMHIPRPLQNELPDQSFHVIGHLDNGVIYAQSDTVDKFGRNPIMVFTPGAPGNVATESN